MTINNNFVNWRHKINMLTPTVLNLNNLTRPFLSDDKNKHECNIKTTTHKLLIRSHSTSNFGAFHSF